jgi:very-short-patch-repair endonuclease
MRGFRLIETRRARSLRKNATSAEAKLWSKLRNRQLGGHKFVRQEPIEPYFADFACREAKLAIEIDGATHSTEGELDRDARRAAFLAGQSYRIVRFVNAEIYGNLDGVLETILSALTSRASQRELTQPLTPALSPRAGRGSRAASP